MTLSQSAPILVQFSSATDRDKLREVFVSTLSDATYRRAVEKRRRAAITRWWYVPIAFGFAVPGAAGVVLGALVFLRSGSLHPLAVVAVIAGFIVGVLAYRVLLHRGWYKYLHEKDLYAAFDTYYDMFGIYDTMEIDHGGVRLRSEHRTSEYKWPAVKRIIRSEATMILVMQDMRHIFVPKAVLDSNLNPAEVFDRIEKYCDQDEHGTTARAIRVLENRSVACEHCRYDLRGASSAFCPECGHRIDVFTLELWAQRGSI